MVAEARARLSLDGKQFSEELGKVSNESEGKLGGAMKKVGGFIAAAFAVQKVVSFGQEALRVADEIDNLSKRLGIGAEATQTLQRVASEAGLSFSEFENILNKTTASSVDAQNGNKKLADAFAAIGVSVDDLKALSPEELFDKIARGMASADGNAQQLEAIFSIIGEKAGPRMQSVLSDIGKNGLPATIDKFKELGLVINGDAISALDKAGDAVDRLFGSVKNFGVEALGNTILWFEELGEQVKMSLGYMPEMAEAAKRVEEEISAARKKAAEDQARLQEEYAKRQQEQLDQINRIAVLERELSDIRKESVPLSEKLAKALSDLAKLEADLAGLSGDTVTNYENQLTLELQIEKKKAEIGDLQSKVNKEAEASLKKQAEQQDRLNAAKQSYQKLAEDVAWSEMSAAEKISALENKRRVTLAFIEDLRSRGLDSTAEEYYAKTRLLEIDRDLKGLQEDITEQQADATDLTSSQVEDLLKMRTLLQGISKDDLNAFIESLTELANKLKGIPQVNNLGWMKDLQGFKLPDITAAQARQFARALTDFFETLKRIPAPDLKFLKDLEALGNIKLPSITSGQAAQLARALTTLFEGIKGVKTEEIRAATDLLNALSAMGGPGKWELVVTLPPGMEKGFPLIMPEGFNDTLKGIGKNLDILANLKGIIWY